MCGKCKISKDYSQFYKNKSAKDGYKNQCKKCRKEYDINYYCLNTIHKKTINKIYRDNNKVKIAKNEKIYREKNRNTILNKKKKYNKKRYKNDPIFNAKCRMRALIRSSLSRKGFLKDTYTAEILGIDWVGFWSHLVDSFKLNYDIDFEDGFMSKVEIDHIIPVSSAKTKDEVIKLNHYTNLQLLWEEDNLKKSNTMV